MRTSGTQFSVNVPFTPRAKWRQLPKYAVLNSTRKNLPLGFPILSVSLSSPFRPTRWAALTSIWQRALRHTACSFTELLPDVLPVAEVHICFYQTRTFLRILLWDSSRDPAVKKNKNKKRIETDPATFGTFGPLCEGSGVIQIVAEQRGHPNKRSMCMYSIWVSIIPSPLPLTYGYRLLQIGLACVHMHS